MLPSDKNTASLHRFVLSFSVLNHSLNALKSVCRLDAFTDKQMDTEENIKGNNLLFSRGDELLSCCVEMTKLVFSLLIDTGIEKKKESILGSIAIYNELLHPHAAAVLQHLIQTRVVLKV